MPPRQPIVPLAAASDGGWRCWPTVSARTQAANTGDGRMDSQSATTGRLGRQCRLPVHRYRHRYRIGFRPSAPARPYPNKSSRQAQGPQRRKRSSANSSGTTTTRLSSLHLLAFRLCQLLLFLLQAQQSIRSVRRPPALAPPLLVLGLLHFVCPACPACVCAQQRRYFFLPYRSHIAPGPSPLLDKTDTPRRPSSIAPLLTLHNPQALSSAD